jgi:hypothetical protein
MMVAHLFNVPLDNPDAQALGVSTVGSSEATHPLRVFICNYVLREFTYRFVDAHSPRSKVLIYEI